MTLPLPARSKILRLRGGRSRLNLRAQSKHIMGDDNNSGIPHWLKVLAIGRRPQLTLVRMVITVATLLLVAHYLVLPIKVQGPSMLPTYETGRVNFINRLAFTFHEPRRGDVVGIRFAGPSIMLMKRVVGLPGETVAFADGVCLINGQPLPEPYLKFPSRWDMDARKLGTNEYFVVGDNRSMAIEDHTFGVADRARILGKVML